MGLMFILGPIKIENYTKIDYGHSIYRSFQFSNTKPCPKLFKLFRIHAALAISFTRRYRDAYLVPAQIIPTFEHRCLSMQLHINCRLLSKT